MTTEDTVVTQQLFGAVRHLPVVGGLTPPHARLREPVPLPEADGGAYGAYLFCSGCGTVQPVLVTAIPVLTGEQKDSYEGYYLQAQRCELDGGELAGVRLLPIPMDS